MVKQTRPALAMIRRALMVSGVVIGFCGSAWGATKLYTGVVEGGNSCNVVNVSTKTRQIRVEIFNFDGTLAFGSSLSLGPGTVAGVTAITLGTQSYCRITVDTGGSRAVRGTFCRSEAGICTAGIAEAR